MKIIHAVDGVKTMCGLPEESVPKYSRTYSWPQTTCKRCQESDEAQWWRSHHDPAWPKGSIDPETEPDPEGENW